MAGRGSLMRRPATAPDPQTLGQVSAPRKRRDGGVSSIELALLAPLVILCILLVGQFAMWYQARHVAIAAAQAGARVARDTQQGQAWEGPAVTTAQTYAQQLGGSLLQATSASAIGAGNQRGVEVRGTAPSLIPGMTFTIDETSEGPTECFRPSADPAQCAGG